MRLKKNQKQLNQRFSKILIFVFILLLPTQLGKHFFLPFSYISGVRVDYLAPTLYLTDLIVVLLFLLNFNFLRTLLTNKKLILGLTLLLIPVLLAISPLESIYKYVKILELVFVCAIFRKKYITNKNLLIAFFLGSVFELILLIFQFVTKHSLGGVFYFFGERYLSLSSPNVAKATVAGIEILRPYGTFSHPNSLAGFYLLLFFFFAANNKFGDSWIKKIFLFICSILILFSFSKLAIGIFVFLNIIFYFVKKQVKLCLPCLLSRMATFCLLGLIFFFAKTDPTSLDKRLELIGNAFKVILSHPWFGVGLGNYLFAQNSFPTRFIYFLNQPVHNIFLLFISEVGVLVAFTLTLINYKQIICLIKKHAYVLLVFVLTGFFDHYWLTLQQNFLLMGVIFARLSSQDKL